jgi:hypothetical protein
LPEKLEKQKNTSKRLKLIPKPKGQAGRSAESGGYDVQITLGLNDQDYNRRRVSLGPLFFLLNATEVI